MDKLKELKDKYSGLLASMQTIIDGSPDGLSKEDQAKFDGLKADAEKVNKQIENLEAMESAKAKDEAMKSRPEPSRGRLTTPDDVKIDNKLGDITQPKIITIPANVRTHGRSLRAFKGPDADVKAYTAGRWLLAIRGHAPSQRWCAEHGLPVQFIQDGQTEGSNTAGGYLVPNQINNSIIDLALEYGKFRQYAGIEDMTSETKSISRVTGGLTAYHVGESTAGTESENAWDQVNLIAKKIMVLAKFSSEINEDAIISMSDKMITQIGRAFAYREDADGFCGDGTSTYGGILGVSNALIAKACTGGVGSGAVTAGSGLTRYDTGYAYSNIALTDITAMMATLPEYARAGAKFYGNPYIYEGVLLQLLAAAGGNTMVNLQDGPNGRRFLGYPFIAVEVMPQAAAVNQIPLLFGDLSLAASYGDRRSTTIMFSEHATVGGKSVFETDEIACRATERFDINVHDVGSSSTRGPVVGLIAHTA